MEKFYRNVNVFHMHDMFLMRDVRICIRRLFTEQMLHSSVPLFIYLGTLGACALRIRYKEQSQFHSI